MLIPLLTLAHAATANELLTAMAVPAADLSSASLSADARATAVEASRGTISAVEGSDFAWIYTGEVGIGPESGTDLGSPGVMDDKGTLTLTLTAPATANSLTFQFYFLSAEYPEFVGSIYDDTFEANVTGSAWSGNAAQDAAGNDISINSVLFTVTKPADLAGTDFESVGGGTGWLTVAVPVDPGTTVELELTVYDVGDGVLDSGVALDDFQWSTADIDTPVIVIPITVDYLSPKRGPVLGGATTTVHGEDFNDGCTAWFDGREASTTFIDDSSLLAEPPPHPPGLVDVTVRCIGAEDTLIGGYTYYEGSDGGLAPELLTVSPYNLSTQGGEEVLLRGEGLTEGLLLTLDGAEMPFEWVDAATLRFSSPTHAPGLVDLSVTNPDGLSDTLYGALQFNEPPELPDTADSAPPADTEPPESEGPPPGSKGCATPGGAALLLAASTALLLRRRS